MARTAGYNRLFFFLLRLGTSVNFKVGVSIHRVQNQMRNYHTQLAVPCTLNDKTFGCQQTNEKCLTVAGQIKLLFHV